MSKELKLKVNRTKIGNSTGTISEDEVTFTEKVIC